MWQKDQNNKNTAYSFTEFVDYLVIFCSYRERYGYFKFPREILKDKSILKDGTNKGKMGFRVYPDWDIPLSLQAKKTQDWQLTFFKEIEVN